MTMTDMTRMPSHASDAIAAPSGPVTVRVTCRHVPRWPIMPHRLVKENRFFGRKCLLDRLLSSYLQRPAGRGGSDAQAIMYAMSRRTVSTDGNIEHSWRHPGSYDGAHGPDTAAQLSRSGPMRVESRYRAMPYVMPLRRAYH
jgi:hypothetical protein